ncbi:MAG TPA: prepilin peptidase [Promineifilum sp.]|nr:prepilin peptidase [Promineifilum sp.]
MPSTLFALVGLFAAMLLNRAADCWLNSTPLACGLTRHPRRAAAVTVALPLLAVLAGRRAGSDGAALTITLFAAVLLLLAVVDWEQRRLPNAVVLPALAAAVALSADPLVAGLAAVAAFVVFLALYALGRRLYGFEALGMGDVKLAALVAAVAGPAAAAALLGGVLLAGGGAAVGLLSGRVQRGAALPYGSFLAVAGLVVRLWGLR